MRQKSRRSRNIFDMMQSLIRTSVAAKEQNFLRLKKFVPVKDRS